MDIKHELVTLPKLLLTVEEAAQALALSRSLMYDLILTKQVESIKIGRSRRIPFGALSTYVSQQIMLQKGA